jgi:hypothetical protein
MNVHELFDRLWADYAAINPQAQAIGELLRSRGEAVVNDHVALRTFDDPRTSIDVLAAAFVKQGYEPRDTYRFREKKLFARHYEHPDASLPKVFISQLELASCSASLREIVGRLLAQLPAALPAELCLAGRLWQVSGAQYDALLAESEYAAWLAAFGFRANHFTVLVNALRTVSGLVELNALLAAHGFPLNAAGGQIKGSPRDYLEQSSTLAAPVAVDFSDGRRTIPGCYYEFARRYPLPDGRLFGGFVEKSADKIFQSTDAASRRG